MSLSKIPLLLTAASAVHVALTRPNPAALSSERRSDSFFARYVDDDVVPLASKAIVWTVTLCETTVILAHLYPSTSVAKQVIAILVRNEATSPASIHITELFLLGWLLCVAGAVIRLSCYRALGRLFTFEVSIRKDHVLVTSGPYGFVRHPSYTGLIMVAIGWNMLSFFHGSWLQECGYLDGPLARGIQCAWLGFVASVCVGVMLRLVKEDEMLRESFGEKWDQWSQNVPYKLIPYVF